MRFRDPKTGEMCGLQGLLLAWIRFRMHRDTDWAKENAEEAARLMGYEVVEDTSTDTLTGQWNTLTENEDTLTEEANMDKPRICEVLGVEVGEEFYIEGSEMKKPVSIHEDGNIYWSGEDTLLHGIRITEIINHPNRIIRKPRFTEQEVERAKAINVLWPLAACIRRETGALMVYGRDGLEIAGLDDDIFPFLKIGETVALDEIIGGAE